MEHEPPPRDVRTVEFWYSPGCILEFADQAVTYVTSHPVKSTSELDKVLGEGRAGAFLAMSLGKQKQVQAWVRLVEPVHQAPDVEVMYFGEQGKYQSKEMLGVEVATYKMHEPQSLGPFILRTKLNGHHSYGQHTAIIIYIQKATNSNEVREAHRHIANAGQPGVVFLLGQVDKDLFQIQLVYPRHSGPVDVRISEALDSPQPKVAQVRRGMSKEHVMSADPIPTNNPFMAYVEHA
ncbi:MAG TPA: hypothetical protein VMU76_00490 [Acidimicrobiales bacterium]|nr:hypothetical protein [Acidimicrobiales bacterium]